jgi:hypothetical protein
LDDPGASAGRPCLDARCEANLEHGSNETPYWNFLMTNRFSFTLSSLVALGLLGACGEDSSGSGETAADS